VKFDPRLFISEPYVCCPACRSQDLGVLSIGPNSLTRRCRLCLGPPSTEALPEIRKRVVYLDQFVLSNITKTLDPRVDGHERAKLQPAWRRIYELLDVLVRAQVIVCPTFENHRTESVCSPFFPQLKWLYDHLSTGVRFRSSEYVKHVQLVEAATAYVESRASDFSPPDDGYTDGIRNGWTDRIRFVTVGSYPPDLDQMREWRERGHENLTATFHRWQTETGQSFEFWFEEERAAFGKAHLEILLGWVLRKARIQAGHEQFTERDLFDPPVVRLLTDLGSVFEGYGVPQGSLLRTVEAFLLSAEAKGIPFLKISAAMYACMAKKAADGQKKPPNQGTFADVTALATLLPVCDAMVIDDKCLATLNDIPRSHRPSHTAALFSSRTLDDLVSWLERERDAIAPEHAALVARLYGEGWDAPNLSVFEQLAR
jgi:hypothetical protein